MKSKSILFFLLVTSVMLTLSNCSGNKKEASADEADHKTQSTAEDVKTDSPPPQFAVEATFQQQLTAVFEKYISLKEAFVLSDATKTITEVSAVQQALGQVDAKLVSDAALNDWMVYRVELDAALKEIQATADIEKQRLAFSKLSYSMYKSIKPSE